MGNLKGPKLALNKNFKHVAVFKKTNSKDKTFKSCPSRLHLNLELQTEGMIKDQTITVLVIHDSKTKAIYSQESKDEKIDCSFTNFCHFSFIV